MHRKNSALQLFDDTFPINFSLSFHHVEKCDAQPVKGLPARTCENSSNSLKTNQPDKAIWAHSPNIYAVWAHIRVSIFKLRQELTRHIRYHSLLEALFIIPGKRQGWDKHNSIIFCIQRGGDITGSNSQVGDHTRLENCLSDYCEAHTHTRTTTNLDTDTYTLFRTQSPWVLTQLYI